MTLTGLQCAIFDVLERRISIQLILHTLLFNNVIWLVDVDGSNFEFVFDGRLADTEILCTHFSLEALHIIGEL